jgi:hypothetical protein
LDDVMTPDEAREWADRLDEHGIEGPVAGALRDVADRADQIAT